jgi:hypothetical protein
VREKLPPVQGAKVTAVKSKLNVACYLLPLPLWEGVGGRVRLTRPFHPLPITLSPSPSRCPLPQTNPCFLDGHGKTNLSATIVFVHLAWLYRGEHCELSPLRGTESWHRRRSENYLTKTSEKTRSAIAGRDTNTTSASCGQKGGPMPSTRWSRTQTLPAVSAVRPRIRTMMSVCQFRFSFKLWSRVSR